MLITPRTYSAAQTLDRGYSLPTSQRPLKFHSLTGWHSDAADTIQDARMLLSYQAGSVRVGEAVRYTISYTPAADPIYPPPEKLYVKVRNTSAAPLRAAYLHGPYTLYAACYPSTFDPNVKYDQQDTDGVPQFEPYVKAGGSWDATITVPQRIRATPTELAAADPESRQSVTWIIEILSQVVFSDTATVNFEVLVGRDEKSAQLSSTGGLSGHGLPQPAQLQEHWSSKSPGEQILATAGVYSKSITLLVDDTTSLWNSPPFPSVDKAQHAESCSRGSVEGQPAMPQDDEPKEKRKKKVHLVILTHGLHSNLGADMLYLKESIDISAKRAKEQAKQHQQTFSSGKCKNGSAGAHSKSADANDDAKEEDVEEDDEQVIVRGFFGNAVRTERGIQYLGKRLAKYVLLMTYPDQSYSPLKSSKDKHLSSQLAALKPTTEHPKSSSSTSDPHEQESDPENHAYQISSISFIGHSLGGLIQTYAIAYIQKYSPQFFDLIEPINFIALATPFLGLSNENPVYVRFALDLGLVGRTGQDLGLSWTAPKVRSGWGAMIGGRGEAVNPQEHSDPGSKPLLRILPCGPAHEVLAKFQHRTIYSNVVNDGIVPLRTSSLLFLDWKGLDRVEKARRDNGLVGTMAEWGWAELTGANSKSPLSARSVPGDIFAENRNSDNTVPSTSSSQRRNNNEYHGEAPHIPEEGQLLRQSHDSKTRAMSFDPKYNGHSSPRSSSPWASFLSLFRPKDAKPTISHKQSKIFKRGQTVHTDHLDGSEPSSIRLQDPEAPVHRNSQEENWSHAPPKTTFLESASDLLMPPLPPAEFLLDPASRPRTIFHDRIYHPEDIPAPLPAKRRTLALGSAQNKPTKAQAVPSAEHQPHVLSHNGKDEPESGLRVEEKIARAYHRDLTWRKVLVRLEPDAHNNIIVRRMFTNAYGWPVVKHLVDTHFGHTSAAQSTDFWGTGVERAKSPMTKTTRSGNEVTGQTDPPAQEVSIDGKQENLPEGAADCKRDTDLPRSDLQKRPDTNEPSDHIQTSTKPSSGKESHTETPGLPDSVRQIDPNLANDDEHGDNDGVRGQQQLSEGNTGETASRQ